MPSLNPFTRLHNWHASRQIAAGLYETLLMVRGPGRGINIPAHKQTAPETVRAIDLLLQAHPEITAEVWADGLLLLFRADLAVLERPTDGDFKSFHQTVEAKPGDDLVMRTELLRLQEVPVAVEQKPRWPGALSGRDPRDVTAGEWSEWNQVQREEAARKEVEARAASADGVDTTVAQSTVNISMDLTSPDAPSVAVQSADGSVTTTEGEAK